MAERPILFSDPMVRALLDGRKSQTRRALKPPRGFVNPDDPNHWTVGYANASGIEFVTWEDTAILKKADYPYAKGDRLWVRETWAPEQYDPYAPTPQAIDASSKRPAFRADWDCAPAFLWKPSIFMPRWASRLTLTVTDVRVERLQDISEADAVAEGVAPLFTAEEIERHPRLAGDPGFSNYLWHGHIGRSITGKQSDAWYHQYSSYKDARGSFSSLWESINGPGAWEANPWIVAISFDVHCCNIDQMEAPDA